MQSVHAVEQLGYLSVLRVQDEGTGMIPLEYRTSELDEVVARLDEISRRSRNLGISLAAYPVADVERAAAVLLAGQFFRPKVVKS